MPKKRHANPWRFFCTLFYGERKEGRHGSEYSDHHGSGAAARNLGGALYLSFFRMLKENAAREEKYQAMIDSLSTNIAEGIEDIQNRLDALTK